MPLRPRCEYAAVFPRSLLASRIDEARINGWLGEVQGLQTSLEAAKRKLVSVDRAALECSRFY
jgi:hypothetical protein